MGVTMAMAARSPQRRRQFAEADRSVAVGIELAKHFIGLRDVGATGAKGVFKFRFGDLAVSIGVDLREQALQRARRAGRRRRSGRR